MRLYTTLQPTRTVVRTHAHGLGYPGTRKYDGEVGLLLEIPGVEFWIMIEPNGQVWTWDGWAWC